MVRIMVVAAPIGAALVELSGRRFSGGSKRQAYAVAATAKVCRNAALAVAVAAKAADTLLL